MLTIRKTRNREYKRDQEDLTPKKMRRKRKKRKIAKIDDGESVEKETNNGQDLRDESTIEIYEGKDDETRRRRRRRRSVELCLETTCEALNPLSEVVDAREEEENKFLIITLLQPEEEEEEETAGAPSQGLGNCSSSVESEDPLNLQNKSHHSTKEIHHRQLLLPGGRSVKRELEEKKVVMLMEEEEEDELLEPLSAINHEEFEPRETYSEEEMEMCSWIKCDKPRVLFESDEGRPFAKCPACNATFFRASGFHRHIATHLFVCSEDDDDASFYVCAYCRYASKDGRETFKHLFNHQDQCEVCNLRLSMNARRLHLEDNMGCPLLEKRDLWGRFVCGLCNVGFDFSHQLEKHYFLHTCRRVKMRQCFKCQAIFETELDFQGHRCLHCPACDMAFGNVSQLKAHTRSTGHYLTCSICSYQFILAVDYAKHVHLHSKPYRPLKRLRHCLISEDDKSYQCAICSSIFHFFTGVAAHLRRDHHDTHDSKKPLLLLPREHHQQQQQQQHEQEQHEQEEIINYESIQNNLKRDLDFEVTCEQVLDIHHHFLAKEEFKESKSSLCWDRYSIHRQGKSER